MSVNGGTKGHDVRSGKGGFSLFRDEEHGACKNPSPRHQRATLPHATGELSLASELFFSWYDPLLKVRRTRFLEQEDIWALPPSNRVSEWARIFIYDPPNRHPFFRKTVPAPFLNVKESL
jgi:hypothetical protein